MSKRIDISKKTLRSCRLSDSHRRKHRILKNGAAEINKYSEDTLVVNDVDHAEFIPDSSFDPHENEDNIASNVEDNYVDSSTREFQMEDKSIIAQMSSDYSPYNLRKRQISEEEEAKQQKINDKVMMKFEANDAEFINNFSCSNLFNDFLIVKEIKLKVNEFLMYKRPENFSIAVHNYSDHTLGEFASDLKAFIESNGLSLHAQKELMELLTKYFPHAELPAKCDNATHDYQINTLSSYTPPNYRTLWFDICENGCVVYAGANAPKIRCDHCGLQRFRKCTQTSCLGKDYEECRHALEYRVPRKRIPYRPIWSFLIDALQHEGFEIALNYINDDISIENVYGDIQSGLEYRKQLAEMNTLYNEHICRLPRDSQIPKKINILLGEFYDGCQIFHSKSSSFWPLMVSILNMPPTYRQKVGIGLFCLSIFTSRTDSVAEQFLLRYCFAGELRELQYGRELTLFGKIFFIQVRLISTVLDTIAVQDVFKVVTSGSYVGCFFCNSGEGYQLTCRSENKQGAKIVYHNNRKFLPMKSFFRSAGNCGCCCPGGYYQDGADISQESKYSFISEDHLNSKDYNIKELQFPPRNYTFRRFCESTCYGRDETVDEKDKRELYNYFTAGDNRWEVYHDILEKTEDIVPYLHYHFSDYTKQRTLTHTTHSSYVRNGKQAEKSKKTVNGVKGLYHLSNLSYANIETQCAWEYMHIFSNVYKAISDLWLNKVAMNSQELEFYKMANIHPYLWKQSRDNEDISHRDSGENKNLWWEAYIGKDPPWVIPKEVQYKVSCTTVPNC